MNLSDILQVILFSGIVFFLMGYKAQAILTPWSETFRRLFLSPRYLKSEGFLSGKNLFKKN